jgi:Domain of unknown function (DUF5624)
MSSYSPDAAFAALFSAFTGGAPQSIGPQLTSLVQASTCRDPLLVSSSSDVALFPGGGAAPQLRSFRKTTRGFIELTAVSHVPLAIAYAARTREMNPDGAEWRRQLEMLLERCRGAREANSPEMWRDRVGVEALAGFERKIADLVEYTLCTSIDLMTRALDSPEMLEFEALRRDYLDAGPDRIRASMNDVMFATFALAILDIIYRIGSWLKGLQVDWTRMMVLVSGQSGRPTAGVTWSSNNMCNIIWRASGKRLPPERLFVAPHAPTLSLEPLPNEAELHALEDAYRRIWCGTRNTIEVARRMFEGYAAHQFAPSAPDALPPIKSEDDHDACVVRLRRIMEDPQQLLANCAADYIYDELDRCDFRPQDVRIPGFSNVDYSGD